MQSSSQVNAVSPDSSVELANASVLLRAYRPSDIPLLYEAARESIAEVGRWLPWCHENYIQAESEAWVDSRARAWQAGQEHSFVIVERTSGRFLGGCGLNQFDYERQRCNLGYWVRTSATRQGYATEAARLLARWGAEALRLERMEIIAAVGNLGSQRVAQKAGAFREGIARARIRIRGTQHNAVVYSFIRRDVLR